MDDAVQGLQKRGLPIGDFDDLTAEELELVHQYTEWALDVAAREVLDMLAQAIRRRRGLPE